METTTNGIRFTEEIVSINGAAFILFPEGHSKADIKAAKREIRSQRDVVSIRVASETDRDEQYRSEIYSIPETRALRWYEINGDDYKLIRRERLKGTSPQEYVNTFVLPCVKETHEANLKEFGTKIYGI